MDIDKRITEAEKEIAELKGMMSQEVALTTKQQQEIAELKEYAQHKQHCKLFGFTSSEKPTKGCTCGLDKLF